MAKNLSQKNAKPKPKRFDTRQLIQNEDIQERYREQIKQGIESMKYKATEENKWEKLKDIIKCAKCAAENNIGYKKKTIGHQISDVDLERMSKDQKKIRLQIENCKDTEKNERI